MILDYEFARLYKILEGSITRMLTTRSDGSEQTKPVDQSAILIAQYNEYIQQQNQHIIAYQQQEKQLIEERELDKKKIVELEQSLKQIYEQYGLLKASSEQGKRKSKRETKFEIFK